jgi:hypothetical protein
VSLFLKVKGKVVPVHAIKTYYRSGVTARLILNLDSGLMGMRGGLSLHLMNRRFGGRQNRYFEPLVPVGNETTISGVSCPSIVTVATTLSSLPHS